MPLAMPPKPRLTSILTALAVTVAALPWEYFDQLEVDSRSTHVESQAADGCGDSRAGDPCASDCHCLCCPSHANATTPPVGTVSVPRPSAAGGVMPLVRALVPSDEGALLLDPPKRVCPRPSLDVAIRAAPRAARPGLVPMCSWASGP
jgi:hypothetical protein